MALTTRYVTISVAIMACCREHYAFVIETYVKNSASGSNSFVDALDESICPVLDKEKKLYGCKVVREWNSNDLDSATVHIARRQIYLLSEMFKQNC